jgi:hypothetical protein
MSDTDIIKKIDSFIQNGSIPAKLREHMIIQLKSKSSEVRKIVNRNIQKVLLTVGVSCFSEQNNNILMWSHYANNHKGICLKFDVLKDTAFFFAADRSKPTVAIGKVIYSPKNYSYLNANDIINQKQILQVIPFTKYEDWRYEKEVRIISLSPGLIKYNDDALVEIIFGCKCDHKEIQSIKNSVKLSSKNVSFSKAIKSDFEFKIDFEHIQ